MRGADPGVVLFIGHAEYGGHWDIRDPEHHVPSPYWLIDPKTGIVVASGELPEGGGMIPDATFEPGVLICSTVPPLIAR